MGCGNSSEEASRRSRDRNNRYRRRHGYQTPSSHGGGSDEQEDSRSRGGSSNGGASRGGHSRGGRSKASTKAFAESDSDNGTVRSYSQHLSVPDGRSTYSTLNSNQDPSKLLTSYKPLFEGRVFISPEEYQQIARRASRQDSDGEPPIHLGVIDARWSAGDPRWGAEDFAKGPRLPDAVFLEANSDLADMQPGGERPLPSVDSVMHLLMEETHLVLPKQWNKSHMKSSGSLISATGSDNSVSDKYLPYNLVRNVVICYDAAHGAWAACRAWWMLDQLGIEAYVINGGLKHYVAKGLAVDNKTLAKPPLGGKRWADGDLTEDHIETLHARWPGTRPGVPRGDLSFSDADFTYETFNPKNQVLLDSRPRPIFQTEKRSLMNGLPGHIKGACCDGFMAKIATRKYQQPKKVRQYQEGMPVGLNTPISVTDADGNLIDEEETVEVEVQLIKDDQTLRDQVTINCALPVTDDSSSDVDAGSPEGKFKQPVLYCGLGVTACFNIACLTHSLRRNGLNVSEIKDSIDPVPSNIPTPKLYVGSWIEYQRHNRNEILETLLARNEAIVSKVVRGNKEKGSKVEVVKQIFRRKSNEDSATGYIEQLVAEDVNVEELLSMESEDEIIKKLHSNKPEDRSNSGEIDNNKSSSGENEGRSALITAEAIRAILNLVKEGHVYTGEDVELATLTNVGPRNPEKPLDMVDLAEVEHFRLLA